jgi:hypothetical protein
MQRIKMLRELLIERRFFEGDQINVRRGVDRVGSVFSLLDSVRRPKSKRNGVGLFHLLLGCFGRPVLLRYAMFTSA